ncbi:hypothetical protein Gpo141_00003733 [Globisporangium polare]
MPATSPIPSSTTIPRRSNHHESETQQQHQQHHNHHQQRSPSVASPPASSAFALRKQWEAKLVSLQRGMEHVQHCRAGDACGSSLCHSTRRLMHTYENHQCPPAAVVAPANPNNNSTAVSAAECKVCKLWDFLMTTRTQMAAIAQLRRPLTHHLSRDAPSSCRVATGVIPGSRRSAASVYSRVLASQKEAVHFSARRRF